MIPPLIRLHPLEVEFGARLIAAAMRAVRAPDAPFVAAWDYRHFLFPLDSRERAAGHMLRRAAAALDVAGECFRFFQVPEVTRPGIIPAHRAVAEDSTVAVGFDPAVQALADRVRRDGAGAVLVTSGVAIHPDVQTPLVFRPGILRISPGWFNHDEEALEAGDAFARVGFPTLYITSRAVPGQRSAHERLDLCAQLGEAMRRGGGA